MVELGRFLPEKVKLKAPLFYSITEQRTSPKYNPLDQDILLKDALDNAGSKAERDSISDASIEKSTVESFSFLSAILIIDNRNKTLLPNLRIHTIIGVVSLIPILLLLNLLSR